MVETTFTVPAEALKIKLVALGSQRQGRVISVSLSLSLRHRIGDRRFFLAVFKDTFLCIEEVKVFYMETTQVPVHAV